MNSLYDLMKRLSNIGQVTEAEEKCSDCGCTPCECDDKKVDEAKKPDADKDGIPDWADKKDDKEEIDESSGYDGSEPLDLSTNPSVNDVFKRALYIYDYEGYSNDMDNSEDDAIDQYVAQNFGQDVLDQLTNARNQSYFGRDDGRGMGGSRGDNLGRSSQPGGDFRTNKAGKMHGQDANMMKNKVADRLGRHPEPNLPEGAMDTLKALGKKALDTLGHGNDEDLIRDMQKKAGLPQTGKKPGEEEVKETALNLLRRYAGIQEAKIEEDDVEEGNEFSGALQKAKAAGQEEFEVAGKKYKVNECGDMSMGAEMSPMSSVSDMASPIQVMGNPEAEAEPEVPHMEVPMAAEAPKATYTLNIQNGENNLSMTTDMPDEIIHIMKLAGVNKGAEVSKKEMPADGEQEVEESGYENTPDNTKSRDPQAHGDIRDWGQKGTGAGKPSYPGTRASGDNPMSEQAMMEDYKHFKAGK